mmetsp:Transcript_11223/g.20019  ORF Transcript_11223/g.20019 Transcript_11223/m.20019 type:complete len:89 (+) Transcript_11223:69-335(+)
MDDYSDYSKNDEEDNDDGLDPGQSWLFFYLTEFWLIKTPPAMMEMDWLVKIVMIDLEKEKGKLGNQLTNLVKMYSLFPPGSFPGLPVL